MRVKAARLVKTDDDACNLGMEMFKEKYKRYNYKTIQKKEETTNK